jgi:hypothetical protein
VFSYFELNRCQVNSQKVEINFNNVLVEAYVPVLVHFTFWHTELSALGKSLAQLPALCSGRVERNTVAEMEQHL